MQSQAVKLMAQRQAQEPIIYIAAFTAILQAAPVVKITNCYSLQPLMCSRSAPAKSCPHSLCRGPLAVSIAS